MFIDCETFTYNNTFTQKKRMGHAAIIRGQNLIIIGGSDGFLHGDIFNISLSFLLDQDTDSKEQCQSKIKNYF